MVFGDTINAICACGNEVETAEHFLSALSFLQYSEIRAFYKS